MKLFVLLSAFGALLLCANARADQRSGFGLTVMVGGAPRPEYYGNGNVYVEAIRGREYGLRVTNPTAYRVAVALSVDGLNTIDAKHTDAQSAAKWIIEPYDSIFISGWQVNDRTARRFFFTGERHSYGAFLGETENLGVIEAVFFQERHPVISTYEPEYPDQPYDERQEGMKDQPRGASERNQAGAAAPSTSMQQKKPKTSDDYAATGMGHRTSHEIESVEFDLDPDPVAKVRIRYEFRPQLVKLGLLPARPTPLDRREHAHGFEGYCPEPN